MNEAARGVLEQVRAGTLGVDEALLKLRLEPFEDLGYAKVDFHRGVRQGAAEVIYGAGKTPEQIAGIASAMRARGVQTVLITRLSAEILERDKVPFYCAAWSNIPSVRSALRAGYHPAWVELTVRDAESVHRMNHGGEA